MFRARERGRCVWPFAISLLALIVTIVLYVGANTDRETAQK